MKLKGLWCSLRRRILIYLFPNYVKDKLKNRNGICLKCGNCCKINYPECPFFIDNKCFVYDNQPLMCSIYPIDETEIKLSGINPEECGYYW